MIVKVVKHGDCTWKYDDEFCRNVTPEQAQERINAVSRIIMNALRRKAENIEDKDNHKERGSAGA